MDAEQTGDDQIVSWLATGDEQALSVLYDRYKVIVYSLIARIVQNRESAEELTQEVFLRVWRQASSFESDRGRLSSWLLAIAHNAAIDEVRRRNTRPQQASDRTDSSRSMLEVSDSSRTTEELALSGMSRATVLQALAALPVTQRQVLEMAYFGGLTQKEVSEDLNVPLGTIKTRTRLGLQRLRDGFVSRAETPDAP